MRRLLIIIMALVIGVSGAIAPVIAAQAKLAQIVIKHDGSELSGMVGNMPSSCDDPCPGCNDKTSRMGTVCHWACMAAAAFVFAGPIGFNLPERIAVKHPLLGATCEYKALAPPAPPPRRSILS
jgi:hypothetical protein